MRGGCKEVRELYKYIVREHNGKFSVRFDGGYFGVFRSLLDALWFRDLVVGCGGDWDLICESEVVPVCYAPLPLFPDGSRVCDMVLPRYVSSSWRYFKSGRDRRRAYFCVKYVDGKCKFFFMSFDLGLVCCVRDFFVGCGFPLVWWEGRRLFKYVRNYGSGWFIEYKGLDGGRYYCRLYGWCLYDVVCVRDFLLRSGCL